MFSSLLDLLLPITCPVCGVEINDATSGTRLDENCWSRIIFINPPCCKLCSIPLVRASEPSKVDTICLKCQKEPPPWLEAKAVFLFKGAGRDLVLGYKYADRIDCTGFLAGLMYKTAADLIKASELIVPVPIGKFSLFWRRYNQSALLAARLAKLASKEWEPVLRLKRKTKDQIVLSKQERIANVKGAFSVTKNLEGKRILLIDDVRTSGATAAECTKVLLKNGAESVRVATLAWTSILS